MPLRILRTSSASAGWRVQSNDPRLLSLIVEVVLETDPKPVRAFSNPLRKSAGSVLTSKTSTRPIVTLATSRTPSQNSMMSPTFSAEALVWAKISLELPPARRNPCRPRFRSPLCPESRNLVFLGFTRIETRVVSCIRAFFLVAWILWFIFRSHLHVNFPTFSHIISACLIMQTNFIFQEFKLRVQKSENQAPQNYQSMFTEVTSFEEVKLSYTRASKFQPLAWRANVLLAAKRGIAWKAAARKRLKLYIYIHIGEPPSKSGTRKNKKKRKRKGNKGRRNSN